MKLDELYAKYDHILGPDGLGVTQTDHFIFDLADENSQKSLKIAFPGIESMLMPESGKYLVVAPIVENQDILIAMFPQQTDGSLGLWAFNTKSRKGCNLIDGNGTEEGKKPTLDNFNDFANMEQITRKFNEFAFMASDGEDSTTEVKDIGSFDVSNDEPVEIPNNTDNEETKMANIKPIQNESELDSELKDTKWVEIPNTTAHGVTVTEDDGAGADPFADGSLDANAPAPEGDAAPADAAPADGGDATPAPEGDATAPADGGDAAAEPAPAEGDAAAEAPVDDDPKAKMRELLAYYTNYMNELVQDPNTSTELISATQEMIDSLISNMESADAIEEVKADGEEAAKDEVAVDDAPAEETPPAEGDAAAPAEGEAAPAEEPVAESVVTEGFWGGFLGGVAGFFLGGGLLGTIAGATAGSAIQNFFHKRDVIKNLDDVQLLILASCKEAAANGVTADDLKKALEKNKDVDLPKEIDGLVEVGVIKKNGDTIMITPEGKKVLADAGYDEKAVQEKAKKEGGDKAENDGEGEGDQQMAAEASDEQAASDAAIDAEIDDLHKDDITAIEPIQGDDILTPGDINNSPVNDVALDDVPPTPDEELAGTAPDMAAPAPTSDVLDDTALPSPDETVDLLGTDDIDDYGVGADGLPLGTYDGDIDALTTSPVAKKINWSSDYATNGMATSDDNNVVVPEVLTELSDYYKKVADEVSKVPGKEDVAMKLQKIQILTQTIQNEWNGITSQIGDTVANSYDLSNMGDLEKDELASQDAMGMIGADVMADQEEQEEDDLKINNDIAAFVESFKHLY